MFHFLKKYSLFLLTALLLTLSFGTIQGQATRVATLHIDFTPSEGSTLLRSEKNTLGTITLRSEGAKINVTRILVEMEYDAITNPVKFLCLLNEFDNAVTHSSTLADIPSYALELKQPFSLEDGEAVTLTLETEMRQSGNVGETVRFRIPRSGYVQFTPPSRYSKVVSGTFPMETSTFLVVQSADDAIVRLEVDEENVGFSGLLPGAKNAVLAPFDVTVNGPEHVKMTQLNIRGFGDALPSINNVRLQDSTGNTLAGPVSIGSGGNISFSDSFLLPPQATTQVQLVGDVATAANLGDELYFRIELPGNIQMSGEDSGNYPQLVQNFPITTPTKVIRGSELSVRWDNSAAVADVVQPGDGNVFLGKLVVENSSEIGTIDTITLHKKGTLGLSYLENVVLEDVEAAIFSATEENNTFTFVPNKALQPGEQATFLMYADIDESAPIGASLGFEVANAADLTIRSATDENLAVIGQFPLRSETITISSATDLQLEAELLPYDLTKPYLVNGVNNAVLGVLHLETVEAPVEVQSLVVKQLGSLPAEHISNLRLRDPYGHILAVAQQNGNSFTFSHPFSVNTEQAQNMEIIADIAAAAEADQTVKMQIALPSSFQVTNLWQQPLVQTIGSFPLNGQSFRITRHPDSIFMTVTPLAVPVQKVVSSQKDVEVMKLEFTNGAGEQIEINRFLFQVSGTADEALRNIRVIDASGRTYHKFQGVPDGNVIVLEDTSILFAKGETKTLRVIADINLDISGGQTFQLTIPGEDSFRARVMRTGSEISVWGNYQLHSNMFLSTATHSSCSLGQAPICGRQYFACETGPCIPENVTYDNLCALQKADAILLAETACSDVSFPAEEVTIDYDFEEETDEDDLSTREKIIAESFPDTDPFSLEGKAARFLKTNNIIGGYPDGTFGGDNPVNRAEFAKFVLNARYGTIAERENTGRFPDVRSGEWYVPFIITAAEKGIINGYPDGTFRPEDGIKRAEFLKMLSIAFDTKQNLPYSYTDVPADEWFAPYAGLAEKYDLFLDAGTTLLPGQAMTRTEVAIGLYQYLRGRESI